MLKMDLSFTEPFTGEHVTETHYFHLSKADLVEMEVEHQGGLQNYLQEIVASEDGKRIIEAFKEIILKSYGVKSEDGKRFLKSAVIREEFASSPAYSELFMSLCTDAEAAAAFVNGIVPGEISDQLKLGEEPPTPATAEEVKDLETPGRNVFEGASTPTPVGARRLTRAEMLEMDAAELRSGLAEGRYLLS